MSPAVMATRSTDSAPAGRAPAVITASATSAIRRIFVIEIVINDLLTTRSVARMERSAMRDRHTRISLRAIRATDIALIRRPADHDWRQVLEPALGLHEALELGRERA